MTTAPDPNRYIDVQLSRGEAGSLAASSEIESTIRHAGRGYIAESPCPVLDNGQRAALYARAASDAGPADEHGRAAVSYAASCDWDFEFLGSSEPSFQPEGGETEMIVFLYCINHAGTFTRFDLPDDGLQPDGTYVQSQVTYRRGSAIDPGGFIGTFFTRGEDRGEALRAMKSALDQTVIEGVETNIPLLSAILSSDEFERGDINAGFIDSEYPEGFTGITLGKGHCRHIAAVCAFMDKPAIGNAKALRYAACVDDHHFTVELTDEPGLTLAAVDEDSDKATVEVELKSDWVPGARVIKIYIDDRLMILHVQETHSGFDIYYRGANLNVTLKRL